MKKSTATKQAVTVFGALALGWLAFELAFKPLLEKARATMDKSDPSRNPNGDSANPKIAGDDD